MFFFLKALLHSLRYKWSIISAILCSVGIALLWSASITTVYPLVEVIFQNQKTIPGWIDAKIADHQTRLTQLADERDALLQKGVATDDYGLLKVKSEIVGEQKSQQWLLQVKPWADRYAPTTPFATLVLVMVWLLATSALKGVLLVLSVILVARVSNRTIWDMRRMYYFKALELDQRRIDQLGTSSMMTQLSHNMQMISAGLAMFYGKMLREPLKMLTCLIGAALISWKLLMISLMVIPFGAYLVHSISRRMKRASLKEIDGMSGVFQTLIETFSAIKTVRIFNREQTERVRFKRNAGSLYRMSQRISLYDSILRPVSEMLGIISIAMATLAGAYLVLNQTTHLFGIEIVRKPLSPSALMMFYALLAGASDPARKMSEIINVLVRGGTACESLIRVFEPPKDSMKFDRSVRIPIHSKQIAFNNVTFCYHGKHEVLKKVNFSIPFGQSLAIVGGNGSGKSTLVNLLARFYDPNEGTVELDGVDLKQLNPKKLRRQMSWVTQDSVLFKGSIRENIRYGARSCTEEQFQRAVKLARVDEFADRMPLGLDNDVGDGGCRLSAGQRQRVALARAIIGNPRILILDEATSQMDGQTELLIHDSLKEFLKQRTTIIITHRASSLKLADRILVMDRGTIVSDNSNEAAARESAEFNVLFAKSA